MRVENPPQGKKQHEVCENCLKSRIRVLETKYQTSVRSHADHSVRCAPGQYIRAGGPFYCAKLWRRHRPTGLTVFEGLHNQNNISHSPCRQTP